MKRLLSCFILLLTVLLMHAQGFVHIVKRGETLKKIARKYYTSEGEIIRNNPRAANGIYVGMELHFPITQSSTNGGSADTRYQSFSQPVENSYKETSGETNYRNSSQSSYSHPWIYFDTEDNGGLEAGVMTDNKLKFDDFWISLGFVFDNGLAIRLIGGSVKYDEEKIKDMTDYRLGLGYNARIRFNDYAFIDLRPTVYYRYYSYKANVGTELKKNSYSKNGGYYNTTIWEKESKSSWGLLLEPRIAVQFNQFYLSIGYFWGFNELKFDKLNKYEGISLNLAWKP